MNGLGFFNLFAGVLQLIVPSYGLRLVRRFGAHRVGWFRVAAFASLAALHLVEPLRPLSNSGLRLDLVFAFASGLLLIGMSHLETLLSERQDAKREEQRLEREVELQVKEKTADLTSANEELVKEIARREQKEKALRESEAQYRFLFTENPEPMWIFDLRTFRFLAVNHAAVRQYGFSNEEFTGMTARDLVPADAMSAFTEEVTR